MTISRKSTPRRNRFRRTGTGAGQTRRSSIGRLVRSVGLAALIVGLALTFVLLHDLATQCRTFAAASIQVRGNRHLDEMTVIRQAGLHPQINILAVRLGQCRRRLLAHPWIAAASVKRRLPDRLEIEITEHRTLALAEMPAGRLLIDENGRPFKFWAAGDPEHLPVIEGLHYADLPQCNAPAPPVYGAAMEALRRWRAFHQNANAPSPFTVLADPDSGMAIETASGLGLVILGFEHYPEKLANLHRFLQEAEPPGGGWQRIDLTQRQRIVVKPGDDPKEA